jgi:SagB-type dehydrogenase family enzyme
MEEEKISNLHYKISKIHEEDLKKVIKLPLYAIEKIFYKSYPRFPFFKLPTKFKKSTLSIEDVILKRRSRRNFKSSFITLNELSKILYFSFGITKKGKSWNEAKRAYPSAGARYPLEIYVVTLKVRGLPEGIYHYNCKLHGLELIRKINLRKDISRLCANQKWVKKASAIIIITCVFERTLMKYGERGYRYIYLDAGHAAQNVYLISTAMSLGCCAIGGFLDDEFNKLLDIEKTTEKTIYLLAIGKIKR